MRKPTSDPQHLKSKILISIYLFRSLPNLYIETINAFDKEEKEKVRLLIKNLIQICVVKKSSADNGTLYLRLTNKGYSLVSSQLLPQTGKPLYTFRRDRGVNHTISDHHYYNFIFVWYWITKNASLLHKNIQIYDDSNLNNCFISFSFESKKVVVSPDILVFQPDISNSSFRTVEFVENDAGGETYRRLFEKMVEYGLLLDSGLQQNAISQATLYLIFHSQTRAKQLLFGEKSILQFFDYANTTRKVKRVSIDVLLKSFRQHKIYYASYDKKALPNPLTFTEYPLAQLLLERRQEWKIYT